VSDLGTPCTATQACTLPNIYCIHPKCAFGAAMTTPPAAKPEDRVSEIARIISEHQRMGGYDWVEGAATRIAALPASKTENRTVFGVDWGAGDMTVKANGDGTFEVLSETPSSPASKGAVDAETVRSGDDA